MRKLVGTAVGLTLLLGACTGGSDDPPTDSASSTKPAAGQPASGQASTFPVPPSASPSAVPVLATVSNQEWTFALTGVVRSGPGQALVEGALTSKSGKVLSEFAEDGYESFERDGKTYSNYDFSGVQLTASGDPKVYLPLRDEQGQCACTDTYVSPLAAGQPYSVYVLMTAPESATTVNVLVKGLPTIRDVKVSG